MTGYHTKRLTILGLLTATAMIFSYLEALLPPISVSFPGIKMGLPNIVILFVFYRFGFKEAAAVSLVRVTLTALLFGNIMTLWYSLAGAVLSLCLMYPAKKWDRFSTIGVSIIGGVSHNLGQILVAMLLMETAEIGYYMIILTVTGTVAGVLIGLAGSLVLKRFPKGFAL